MASAHDDLGPLLTWELLAQPQHWQLIEAADVAGGRATAITLRRRDDRTIEVAFETTAFADPVDQEAGSFAQPETVELQPREFRVARIGGLLLTRVRETLSERESEYHITARAWEVEATQSTEEPGFLTEWVVGMPRRFWFSSTSTTRGLNSRRVRGPADWSVEVVRPTVNEHHSRDHAELLVALGGADLQVLVGVCDTTATDRSAGFIEYRSPLPSNEVRERVRGALGFMLGNCISRLGEVSFMADGRVCRSRAESVYRPGGERMLEYAMPPTILDDRLEDGVNPLFLGRAVERLVGAHDDLGLGHFYWLYWHAAAGTLDLAAGLYGSALEHLYRCYYKAPQREPRTKLFDEAAWRAVRGGLRSALDASTSGLDADAIQIARSKLDGLNQVPNAVAISRFFEDLGLQVGDVEKRALRLRNSAAHGGVLPPGEERAWLLRLRAFQTVVNRVLLAVSGASDHYFDFSTRGHPLRALKDPLGGPDGDGKSA